MRRKGDVMMKTKMVKMVAAFADDLAKVICDGICEDLRGVAASPEHKPKRGGGPMAGLSAEERSAIGRKAAATRRYRAAGRKAAETRKLNAQRSLSTSTARSSSISR